MMLCCCPFNLSPMWWWLLIFCHGVASCCWFTSGLALFHRKRGHFICHWRACTSGVCYVMREFLVASNEMFAVSLALHISHLYCVALITRFLVKWCAKTKILQYICTIWWNTTDMCTLVKRLFYLFISATTKVFSLKSMLLSTMEMVLPMHLGKKKTLTTEDSFQKINDLSAEIPCISLKGGRGKTLFGFK